MQIVEHAEPLGRCEIDADLFVRLTNRSGYQVAVPWFTPAAWKRNLPRPRVTDAYGAMDEQRFQSFIAVPENHRDGCRDHSIFKRNLSRLVLAQLATCILDGGHYPLGPRPQAPGPILRRYLFATINVDHVTGNPVRAGL